VAAFKINVGEVIEVPAQQLASQRSAPRMPVPPAQPQAAAGKVPAEPANAEAPQPTEPAPKAAPAPRLTQVARPKPAPEAATTVRPLRRPASRPASAKDAAPAAPASSRRPTPAADDDWESF